MDTWTGTETDEARHLRVFINDLLSLLALPAMWSGRNAPQIMGSLLDSLLGMLRLDLTYARLHDPEGAPPTEALRTAQRLQNQLPHEVGRILDDGLASNPFAAQLSIPNPLGEGEMQIAHYSLGLQEESGVLIAGSLRPDFPSETDALLLRVAANQAAIALENVRLFELAQRERACPHPGKHHRQLFRLRQRLARYLLQQRGRKTSATTGPYPRGGARKKHLGIVP
jgi:GAF domain-containing protein